MSKGSMGDGPSESWDPELDALLDVERHATVPAAALANVRAKVAGIGAAGAVGAARTGGTVAGARGWLAAHVVGVGVGVFVVGVAVGALGYAAVAPGPAERVVYRDRVATAPSVAIPRTEAAPASPSVSPMRPAPSMAAFPHPSASAGDSLSAERAMLDEARVALTGEDGARALRLLDEHVHRFRKPQLGEEREALAVQALVTLRRYDDARARGARFKETTPNSLFVPVVEAALASIP